MIFAVGMIVGAILLIIGVILGAAITVGARDNKENEIDIPR